MVEIFNHTFLRNWTPAFIVTNPVFRVLSRQTWCRDAFADTYFPVHREFAWWVLSKVLHVAAKQFSVRLRFRPVIRINSFSSSASSRRKCASIHRSEAGYRKNSFIFPEVNLAKPFNGLAVQPIEVSFKEVIWFSHERFHMRVFLFTENSLYHLRKRMIMIRQQSDLIKNVHENVIFLRHWRPEWATRFPPRVGDQPPNGNTNKRHKQDHSRRYPR